MSVSSKVSNISHEVHNLLNNSTMQFQLYHANSDLVEAISSIT